MGTQRKNRRNMDKHFALYANDFAYVLDLSPVDVRYSSERIKPSSGLNSYYCTKDNMCGVHTASKHSDPNSDVAIPLSLPLTSPSHGRYYSALLKI